MNQSGKRSGSRRAVPRMELYSAFAQTDRDGDGRVDFAEFRQLLEGLEAGMSDEEMRIGFQEVDSDRDGLIDRGEFIDWWGTD